MEGRLDRRGHRWGMLGTDRAVQVAHDSLPAPLPCADPASCCAKQLAGTGIGDDQISVNP